MVCITFQLKDVRSHHQLCWFGWSSKCNSISVQWDLLEVASFHSGDLGHSSRGHNILLMGRSLAVPWASKGLYSQSCIGCSCEQ